MSDVVVTRHCLRKDDTDLFGCSLISALEVDSTE